jgi:putative oxidoreductase
MTAVSELFLSFIPYIALITRVWVGVNMMIHGFPKIKNLKQTSEQMNQAFGIPIKATYIGTILEFFGGLLLIIGLIVPIVALFFAIYMIVIIFMKITKMKAAYINPNGPSIEIDITYLIISIILVVIGSGILSVDSLIGIW